MQYACICAPYGPYLTQCGLYIIDQYYSNNNELTHIIQEFNHYTSLVAITYLYATISFKAAIAKS